MIQWIALALAADAESSAGIANEKANEALHSSNLDQTMIIVRPVDLIEVPIRKSKGFWDGLGIPSKFILSKTQWVELSIRRGDVKSLIGRKDDDGNFYVKLGISKYASIYRKLQDGDIQLQTELIIPGTLENVTSILNGSVR